MTEQHKTKKQIIRIGKYLNEIIEITDSTGNIISKAVKPLMIEFHLRDIMQVVVGATILAIPVSFTEEVWKLGEILPFKNIIWLSFLSFVFVGLFVYHNFYRQHIKTHPWEFIKRVLSIYIFSLCIAGLILFIIDKAPLTTDFIIAIKRMIIVALPASMSAAVADMIK